MNYPEVTTVLPFVESLAPKDFVVTYEYENSIGIDHPTFTDDQMIMFGDVNGYFAFNDSFGSEVSGDMERIYDPKEIAESFWNQISKIYPDLFDSKNACGACGQFYPTKEANKDGFHSSDFCSAFEESN